MALSTTTNPKRPRPAFNPPRPKTNGNGVSKSTTSTKKSKSNIGSIFADDTSRSKPSSKSKPKSKLKSKANTTPATSRRAGVREQEPESEDADDDEQRLVDDEADAEEDDSDQEQEEREATEDTEDADMMLAEITHSPAPAGPSDPSSDPSIPIPLLHRLLHHSFQRPESTKLSTDARACVAKYIEVFIREAIARCAFEVGEKAAGGSDSAMVAEDDGWLEVEDLERVGGQLVLDF